MRVLIYSDAPEARAEQAAWLAGRYHASLRSADLFSPKELERCAIVVTDREDIRAAYEAIGVTVHGFGTQGGINEKHESAEEIEANAQDDGQEGGEEVRQETDVKPKRTRKTLL